ncbi:MAG: biotin--[acetyl-CoA-carboxylase] ligase, partial [Magnetospirillum sp.]|nr:biotin--[acetyl-CoA-carboxylase] ligase [Magnetospirillum sp.]
MTEITLPAPFNLIRLDSVGSTNDEARRLVLSGSAADLLVVTAREQSAGRGRRGRVWISPPGNLHCSTLIRINGNLATAAQLGFVAAIALVDAFRALVPGIPFACKWPNDVLAEGRKCSGMLLEPVDDKWLILGIGVDVAEAPPPAGLVYPTCALADLGFAGTEQDVLAAFCSAFGPLVEVWRHHGFAPIRDAWVERAQGIGDQVVVRLDG